MTIHNLKFQGVFDIDTFKYNTALPDYMFTSDKLEFHKDANMLKGGLVYSDYITTVSETYAEEIKYPFFGEQLDGLLRARSASLRGIVNGIDYKVFDPSNDKKIFAEFNTKNVKTQKAVNKEKLQAELGLPVDKDKYMIAIISRLTDQKGLDLVNYAIERICDENTQFVIIGTGEQMLPTQCSCLLSLSLAVSLSLSHSATVLFRSSVKQAVLKILLHRITNTTEPVPVSHSLTTTATKCSALSTTPSLYTTTTAQNGIKWSFAVWKLTSHGTALLVSTKVCTAG